MKTKFLFPNYLRPVGLILLFPGVILGVVCLYFDYEIPGFALQLREHSSLLQSKSENFTNELALLLITVGLLFVAFTREKNEDELLSRIRLNALYWAILINTILFLLLTTVFTISYILTGGEWLSPVFGQLTYYNLFTPLIIFIARYQYLIRRDKDMYVTEKLYYLPEKPFRILGILFAIPLLCITLYGIYDFWMHNYLQCISLFTPLPLIVWAYTRRAEEDEFIASLRLQAMQLAIYIYYGLLLIANLLLYSLLFLFFINLSTIIILIGFIIVFARLIRKHSYKELREESKS